MCGSSGTAPRNTHHHRTDHRTGQTGRSISSVGNDAHQGRGRPVADALSDTASAGCAPVSPAVGLGGALLAQRRYRRINLDYPEFMQTTRGLDRLIFFTDAITAIAITLLILPLVDSIAQAADAGLSPAQFLAGKADEFIAFALSFVVIARLWVAHHSTFEHVKAYSGTLLLLNFGWAFTIVFLPFPTVMLSQFATDPITIGLYIGTMALSSIALTTMVLLIRRHPLIELESYRVDGSKVFESIATTVGFLLALLLGLFVPSINFWALFLLLLTAPLQRIYNHRAGVRRSETRTTKSRGSS